MVDKAREYGYKNIGLILDSDYCSLGNIQYFDKTWNLESYVSNEEYKQEETDKDFN